ncbi:MAG: hypothetical protein HKN73_18175 [Gemmatimonadetes bacterium]|nr:hypothetical protein [Gemmatimonadota bacterium]
MAPDLAMVGEGPAQASGGGKYLVTLGSDELGGSFSFAANDLPNGKATGQLRYTIDFFGEHVEFHGSVTCLSVDQEEGRAWIGGVITRNVSVAELWASGEIYEPGRDIWFRVLDSGEGEESVDRTTFVGFEGGGGIPTSQEYCDAMIWPDDNARTWPVTAGNIQVR